MSDAVPTGGQAVVTTASDATKAKGLSSKKKTAASGKIGSAAAKKQTANHPKYSEMVHQALSSLKERGGSSRQAVLKYIMKNFNVGKDENVVNTHLKIALRAGVKNAMLKQSKGSGATGSFRLGEEAKKKPKAAAAGKTTKKAKAPPAAKIRKTKTNGGDKSVKSPTKKMTKKSTTKSATKSTSKPKVDQKVTAKKSKMDKPKKSAAAVAVKKVKADKTKKSPKKTAGATTVVKKPIAKKTPLAKKSTKPVAVKKA